MTLLASLRKELLEQWRTYRFIVVVVALTLFGMLSPVIAKVTPEMLRMIPGGEQFAALVPTPTLTDAIAQYVKNMRQLVVFLGILVTMGSVAVEKSRGTAAMILVKPLPRKTFLLAKLLSHLFVFGVAILLAGLGSFIYAALLFEPLPILPWILLNVLLLIYASVFVSLTLFFSTVSKSQAVAAGLASALVLVMALAGTLPAIARALPGHLIEWGVGAVSGTGGSAWLALSVALGIVVAAQSAASFILKRQEL